MAYGSHVAFPSSGQSDRWALGRPTRHKSANWCMDDSCERSSVRVCSRMPSVGPMEKEGLTGAGPAEERSVAAGSRPDA